MSSRQLKIFELVLLLSIAFIPSVLKSLFHIITGLNFDYSRANYSDYVISIAQCILAISLLFYILYKNGLTYSEIGLTLKFEWLDLLIGVGLIFASSFIGGILIELVNSISPGFSSAATNPQNIGFLQTKNYVLLFLYMILTPLVEELIVRGYTMAEVLKLTESKTLAIIVSVGIQFTYHLYQGIAPAILMLPLFILMSIYFVKFGKLNPIIYAHLLIDLIYFIRIL